MHRRRCQCADRQPPPGNLCNGQQFTAAIRDGGRRPPGRLPGPTCCWMRIAHHPEAHTHHCRCGRDTCAVSVCQVLHAGNHLLACIAPLGEAHPVHQLHIGHLCTKASMVGSSTVGIPALISSRTSVPGWSGRRHPLPVVSSRGKFVSGTDQFEPGFFSGQGDQGDALIREGLSESIWQLAEMLQELLPGTVTGKPHSGQAVTGILHFHF